MRFRAYFFDMDGVLYNSMPSHAIAWSQVLNAHGLPFSPREAYLNEGRTGASVIRELAAQNGTTVTEEDIQTIYDEKSQLFHSLDKGVVMPGILDVLHYLKQQGAIIWIVTGSGQKTLLQKLDSAFPGIFCREQMVTAYDVQYGKPDPEPYLKAWQGTGLKKEECCVIENAPLGIRAGKAAGLFTIAVNTGILTHEDLAVENPDIILNDMNELLNYLQK